MDSFCTAGSQLVLFFSIAIYNTIRIIDHREMNETSTMHCGLDRILIQGNIEHHIL